MNSRNNQRLGAAFERAVQRSFAARPAVFTVERVTPPARIIGRRVVFLANPFLDFIGTVRFGEWTHSRMIVVECKATKGGRLRIGQGGLSQPQLDSMNRWHAAGAVTFLLWLKIGSGVKIVGVPEIQSIARDRRYLDHALDGAWIRLSSSESIVLDIASAVRDATAGSNRQQTNECRELE